METEDEDLIITPVPALLAVLLSLEQRKGAPLTEREVIATRDAAVCVALPRGVHESLAEDRGYDDIDPDRAWEQWSEIRMSLHARDA